MLIPIQEEPESTIGKKPDRLKRMRLKSLLERGKAERVTREEVRPETPMP